jgi:hypothetical protein
MYVCIYIPAFYRTGPSFSCVLEPSWPTGKTASQPDELSYLESSSSCARLEGPTVRGHTLGGMG